MPETTHEAHDACWSCGSRHWEAREVEEATETERSWSCGSRHWEAREVDPGRQARYCSDCGVLTQEDATALETGTARAMWHARIQELGRALDEDRATPAEAYEWSRANCDGTLRDQVIQVLWAATRAHNPAGSSRTSAPDHDIHPLADALARGTATPDQAYAWLRQRTGAAGSIGKAIDVLYQAAARDPLQAAVAHLIDSAASLRGSGRSGAAGIIGMLLDATIHIERAYRRLHRQHPDPTAVIHDIRVASRSLDLDGTAVHDWYTSPPEYRSAAAAQVPDPKDPHENNCSQHPAGNEPGAEGVTDCETI